jgi:hypothetical protein
MLYGAAYFTEDEWIKIDVLIHKGQYVFTRGPQDNILEEALISFEGSIVEKAQFNAQIHANSSFDTIKAGHVEIKERPIPSPTSSEPADSALQKPRMGHQSKRLPTTNHPHTSSGANTYARLGFGNGNLDVERASRNSHTVYTTDPCCWRSCIGIYTSTVE